MTASSLFTVEYRARVSDCVIAYAAEDSRVVAGAMIGSLALGDGDRWSDLDLTFGVADGVDITAVLEDWTQRLAAEFAAVMLFDLRSGPSIYRVFLLPGCLQFDLSFTPASQFGATGPKFRLLFGNATHRPEAPAPDAQELFGYAVHHALRARFCIERGRYWQAEYWISGVRDNALSLACRRRGLPAWYGRGYDDLPEEVQARLAGALVARLERAELLGALGAALAGLLAEAEEVGPVAAQVAEELTKLTAG